MKHFIAKTAATAVLAVAIMATGSPRTVEVSVVNAEPVPLAIVQLSRPQRAWLGALEWCESRGRAEAVNPKDRDNTPSYGLLQFKPSTLTMFEKAYGIKGELMDPDVQEAIVVQMILRGGVDWHQQFPDCVKKLGLPPKVIH